MRGTSSILLSKEGVTLGDPLSMLFYAIGSLPLIKSLSNNNQSTQVWCVDDAPVCGSIESLIEWLTAIKEKGPKFGYFPKPSKSYLVVSENYISEDEMVFSGTGVNVACCRRGVIGNEKKEYVKQLVNSWKSELERLSTIAISGATGGLFSTHPILAIPVDYIQRLGYEVLFNEIESMISEKFLPNMIGSVLIEIHFHSLLEWVDLELVTPQICQILHIIYQERPLM